MGTVLKRGETYHIRFEGPRRENGQRRQIIKACPGLTKKQAEQRLREEESQVARGEYRHPTTLTVADYLTEWLTHARTGLAESTYANYTLVVRTHLVPSLGVTRLDALTPMAIQRFYRALLTKGSHRTAANRALSPKTVKNIHGILHKALAQAVRWRLLATNPADAVELPKCTRPRLTVAAPAELQQLLAATEDAGVWRLPLLLAIGTGMRRGEVLALQWQDYTPDTRTLVVRRALSHITHTQVIVKGTKTDRVRVVLIHPALAEALNRHRAETPCAKPTDWICGQADGRHHLPRHFTRYFERLAARLGLSITLHGLRHAHATTLIAAGVPVKAVSERLGHSTVVITQDTYAHVLPTMQAQAVAAMEALWQG